MTDKRIEKTLGLIKSSYIKLLRKKNPNKITVKDICDEANINRGTFYKHYADIFDLRQVLEYEAANKIALSILSKYNFDAQPKASINNLFRCLKESPDDAFLLFSQSSINNYTFDVFYKIIEEKALPEWLKKSNISNEQGEIIFYHTIYSIFNLLRLWYNGNVKMCEDDFKELYHDLINYGVYYYIYSK